MGRNVTVDVADVIVQGKLKSSGQAKDGSARYLRFPGTSGDVAVKLPMSIGLDPLMLVAGSEITCFCEFVPMGSGGYLVAYECKLGQVAVQLSPKPAEAAAGSGERK